jgi:hypothetical protein
MEISAHDRAVYAWRAVHEVVVIVPINPEVNEAQDVTEEDGEQGAQCRETGAVGHFQLQHHDGDDDRDNRRHRMLRVDSSASRRRLTKRNEDWREARWPNGLAARVPSCEIAE